MAEAAVDDFAGGAGHPPGDTIGLVGQVAKVAQLAVADVHARAITRQHKAATGVILLVDAVRPRIPGGHACVDESQLPTEHLDPYKAIGVATQLEAANLGA